MSSVAPITPPLTPGGSLLKGRALPFLALSLCCLLAAQLVSNGNTRLGLMTVAAAFPFCAVLLRGGVLIRRLRSVRQSAHVRGIVDDDAAPCFSTDADGHVRYRNKAAEVRFGRSDGASLVATLGDIFAHPSAVLYRLQSRAVTLGAAREDVVTRRGHVRLSVNRVHDGSFLWRLEEMLDRSGAAVRGAEGLSLPMMVASKTGTILFMNEALRRLAGGRPRTIDRVFTELPIRSGEAVIIAGADGPVRALVAEIEGAGERREIYLLPVAERPDHADALPTLPVSATEEEMPVALVRLGADGAIRSANRRARDLLGIDVAGDPGTPNLGDVLEGPGRNLGDWLSDVAAGRSPERAEVLRIRGGAKDQFVQMALHRDDFGGLSAILTDATAMKTLEAQFVQSQKMQAIGQLAGGVAHDFNNLLTAISGHCDLLLLRHDRGDPDYSDLVQIHQNSNRAAALVNQLLAFSRKQTLLPEQLDLAEVLSDITHLLNRLVGEKVSLVLSPNDEVALIRADRRQLEQVLVNIVVNARDAMPAGGTIRIGTSLRCLEEPFTHGRATVPPGKYAVVLISDEGQGIEPEMHQKIFEPFFTTKRTGEGTGLGLSTAYGIVKQTGGFIFADSAPGKGSTFTLYFPVHAASKETAVIAQVRPAPRAISHGQGVVLLVEDEAPVRAFASRALRLRGYTVLEADSAEEALRTLEDPALSVDVFVTDVIMPGMDGPSWVRKALQLRPDVRVVFVSGYAEDCISDVRGEIPNAVFLPKPFSLEDLTLTVQGQFH